MLGRKRTRGPGLVAFGVFLLTCFAGTVSGLAATGPANFPQLTPRTTGVSACQTAPLQVSFVTSYDAQLAEYGVTAVVVSGLDSGAPANCSGKRFQVALADNYGNALSETSGMVPMSGTTFSTDVTGANVRASEVAAVHVLISD